MRSILFLVLIAGLSGCLSAVPQSADSSIRPPRVGSQYAPVLSAAVDYRAVKTSEREKVLLRLAEFEPEIAELLISEKVKPGTNLFTRFRDGDVPGLTKVTVTGSRLSLASHQTDIEAAKIELMTELVGGRQLVVALGELRSRNKLRSEIDLNFYRKLPNWPRAVQEGIGKGTIRLGMTRDQVAASWGAPRDMHTTNGSWGTHEQWVYQTSYVYFRNGRVDAVQQ